MTASRVGCSALMRQRLLPCAGTILKLLPFSTVPRGRGGCEISWSLRCSPGCPSWAPLTPAASKGVQPAHPYRPRKAAPRAHPFPPRPRHRPICNSSRIEPIPHQGDGPDEAPMRDSLPKAPPLLIGIGMAHYESFACGSKSSQVGKLMRTLVRMILR